VPLAQLGAQHLVYLERVKTTRVFVRDVTPVPPHALLLFARGNVEAPEAGGGGGGQARGSGREEVVVRLDGWLGIRVPRRDLEVKAPRASSLDCCALRGTEGGWALLVLPLLPPAASVALSGASQRALSFLPYSQGLPFSPCLGRRPRVSSQVVLEVRAQLLDVLRRKVEQPHLELGGGAKALMHLVVALLANAESAQGQGHGSPPPPTLPNSHRQGGSYQGRGQSQKR
jgi:hypothetical protein